MNQPYFFSIPNDEGTQAKDNEEAKVADDKGTELDDEEPEESMSVKGVVFSEEFLLLLGLLAIAIDPLLFYLPTMKIKSSTCLGLDKTLMIVVVILRTSVDILHDCSWWSKHEILRFVCSALMEGLCTCGFFKIASYIILFFPAIIYSLIIPPRRHQIPGLIIIISSLPIPQVCITFYLFIFIFYFFPISGVYYYYFFGH